MAVPVYVKEINAVLDQMKKIIAGIEVLEKEFKSKNCNKITFSVPYWKKELPTNMVLKFDEYVTLLRDNKRKIDRFLSGSSKDRLSEKFLVKMEANLETVKMKIAKAEKYEDYINLMIRMSEAMKKNIISAEADLRTGLHLSWGETA